MYFLYYFKIGLIIVVLAFISYAQLFGVCIMPCVGFYEEPKTVPGFKIRHF